MLLRRNMKYSKETSTLLQDAGLDVKNVGSSEAQIALLTDRIRSLTCLLYTSPSPRD